MCLFTIYFWDRTSWHTYRGPVHFYKTMCCISSTSFTLRLIFTTFILWLVSASFIVRLDEPRLILQTVELCLTTEIFPHVMSTMALMIFLLIDMRMWYLLLSSRAGFGFDISLSRLCVYIRVSFAGLNNVILDAIYGRWHGSCLYCAWFIYRGTCWHAVMIFNVVIHVSWCAISLTIWTSYWINGINLLSCPHGQCSSQKRGLTF